MRYSIRINGVEHDHADTRTEAGRKREAMVYCGLIEHASEATIVLEHGADMPPCEGWCAPRNPVTHIGSSGYVYCPECAVRRRKSGHERTRQMTDAEKRTIASGKPLAHYRKGA